MSRRAAVVAALIGALAAVPAPASSAPLGLTRPVTWMAAGDSYSAGEGIPRSGRNDSCARSEGAYGPVAAELLRTQRQWFITPVSHNACTGKLAGDFYNGAAPTGATFRDWGYRMSPPALGRFDVVTMSFGGNDLGFSEIVKGCLDLPLTWAEAARDARLDYGCSLTEEQIRARVDRLVAGDPSLKGARPFGPGSKKESLAAFYAGIANRELTDDGILVVVGYPQLFEPHSKWAPWRSTMCAGVFARDAEMLRRVGERLDNAIKGAVTEARTKTKRRIEYVSLADLYRGHSLCARDTEWLNGFTIGFWDGSARPAHGYHPNEVGHRVTGEKVAEVVGEVAALAPAPRAPVPNAPQPPVPVPTTTPPRLSTGSRYGIGDAFDAGCTVAWPTAPTRTSRHIQMTMTCPGVPQQFTFVSVTYADPDLPITPSTGQVRVRGEIVDIAMSEYGFKVLVVMASDVVIP